MPTQLMKKRDHLFLGFTEDGTPTIRYRSPLVDIDVVEKGEEAFWRRQRSFREVRQTALFPGAAMLLSAVASSSL